MAGTHDAVSGAGGTVFDIVLRGETTDGAISLLDETGSRGDVTPVHIHRAEEDTSVSSRANHGLGW